jgi:flagellar protein FlaG
MDITGVNGVGQIPATAPAPAAPERVAENRDIVQAVKAVNAASSFGDNNEVNFLLDRNTKLPVIRIVNKDTKEVVEQIPAESLLQLAAELAKSGH